MIAPDPHPAPLGPTLGDEAAFAAAAFGAAGLTAAAIATEWLRAHPVAALTLGAGIAAAAAVERRTRPVRPRRPTACPKAGPHHHPFPRSLPDG